jgi:hypothetical protein
LLVGDFVLAAVCQADNEPTKHATTPKYAVIERFRIMDSSRISMSLPQARQAGLRGGDI